jgi:hypothetical protein
LVASKGIKKTTDSNMGEKGVGRSSIPDFKPLNTLSPFKTP